MESDVSDFEVKSASEDEKSDNVVEKKRKSMDEKTIARKKKRGVVYLSTIPRFMNVIKLREILGEYGEIGRVFLQPGKPTKKNKPAKFFTEGWVEFESKRTAKSVAVMLNNKMIGGRKKSKFYDQIWNIKYLPRFKWIHLSERLAYEQSVRKQRMQTEILQAKREANYYSQRVEQNAVLRKREKLGLASQGGASEPTATSERRPRAENPAMEKIKAKQREAQKTRKKFLTGLFA